MLEMKEKILILITTFITVFENQSQMLGAIHRHIQYFHNADIQHQGVNKMTLKAFIDIICMHIQDGSARIFSSICALCARCHCSNTFDCQLILNEAKVVPGMNAPKFQAAWFVLL